MQNASIDQLTQYLAKLPGLGPRSARRVVLYLIKRQEGLLRPLIKALDAVAKEIRTCATCGNVDTNDPCGVCSDVKRDHKTICVVEDVADLWALERTGIFKGVYHVLGGTLSALDGVGPDDLNIPGLVRRTEQGNVGEVVLALSATVDGQTTAHYIAECINRDATEVTALAHGVPVGGELDYLDEGTLTTALRARRGVS
ncbi:MAG: recombination protein RecR [Rhodospirillales bacterium]|jgi:recombination protein RecR|nr:recombination protein RecR [Rhodospirillales bacterium]MBT4039245.1 recombination protein RecR [Rhodospirillales bacterium]MBT4626927.1 recombination protein RecR [Rhodospirillales bacterium]MBT5352481.1 recombination protein RecR [Rhodospirillales bacterium]MBT5521096.1 recombination protein RecR [Rhodospirillales bacterium]